MGGECSKCGSSFVEKTAICKECKWGFPLCSNCDPDSRCPKCDTPWPDWNIV